MNLDLIKKEFPIFEDPELHVVGSMKEKTKAMSKLHLL